MDAIEGERGSDQCVSPSVGREIVERTPHTDKADPRPSTKQSAQAHTCDRVHLALHQRIDSALLIERKTQ